MALILANLRLSGKTPISRDSEKIDAKGKAIRDEASSESETESPLHDCF